MRALSAALLSLAVVGGKGDSVVPSEAPTEELSKSFSPAYPASTAHSYVVKRLISVFGEENCSETTQENDPNGFAFLDGINSARMACVVEVSGFSGTADYYWHTDEPIERPKYLSVSYGYTGGSSGLVDIDFSNNACGIDCVEPYFDAITLNTLDGGMTNFGSSGPSVEPIVTPTVNPTMSPTKVPEVSEDATSPSPTEAPISAPTVVPASPTNAPGVTVDNPVFGPVNPEALVTNTQVSTRSNSEYKSLNDLGIFRCRMF